MSTQIDFAIMELLCSKVCHDLISPIGAVNNGMEFVEEMGADAGKEVFDLISFSAGQASAKLRAYRMAYGAGGADTSIKPEDVHATIEAIVGAEEKIKQDWDPYAPLGPDERPEGLAKLLVCGLLLAIEALPKGGTLGVKAQGQDVLITATGQNAGLRDEMEDCLSLGFSQDDLEPKHVHPYLSGLIAKRYDYGLKVSEHSEGSISFLLTLPA